MTSAFDTVVAARGWPFTFAAPGIPGPLVSQRKGWLWKPAVVLWEPTSWGQEGKAFPLPWAPPRFLQIGAEAQGSWGGQASSSILQEALLPLRGCGDPSRGKKVGPIWREVLSTQDPALVWIPTIRTGQEEGGKPSGRSSWWSLSPQGACPLVQEWSTRGCFLRVSQTFHCTKSSVNGSIPIEAYRADAGVWPPGLGLNPDTGTSELCDFGQLTWPLWASDPLLQNGEGRNNHHMVSL